MLLRVAARDRGAPIAGTVVHEEELPSPVGLGEYARDGLLNERLGIEEIDDD
jgi:hypothetical protein